MSKIKILYTIPNFKTAGSQYVLLSLFRNIDRTIFEPYICIEKFPQTVPADVLENQLILFEWSGKKARDVIRFRTVLKKNKIDVLHSWDYKSNYLEALACRMAGVKYLYTKKNNAWSKRWKLKSLLSSHIAYDNPEMKDQFFASWLFRNKISFIPHGVDTDIFKPWGTTIHKNFNLVCIGNIGSNKNQLFLLKALKKLPRDVVLHLYGNEDVEYRKQLDKFIADNELDSQVIFHGFVENKDIPEVLRNKDLFILPSHNEGLPVSILEALACGVPVLSSDSGGGARYLLDSEYIFDLDNCDVLTDKILRFYGLTLDERQVLAEKGVQTVKEKFDVKKEVATYGSLYRTIIGN